MKRHAVLLALLAFASSGHALEMTTDTYFVASIGQSHIDHSALYKTNTNFIGHSGLAIKDMYASQNNSNDAFKLQMGYEFTPNWSVEGGYVDLGKSTYNTHFLAAIQTVIPPTNLGNGITGSGTFNTTFEPFSYTRVSKISGWNVAGVGTFPINDRWSFLGKLGLMRAEMRSHDSGAGFGTWGNATEHRIIPTYGFGASYKVNKVFGLRAEFEKYPRIGRENTTGVTDVDLGSVGLSAKF